MQQIKRKNNNNKVSGSTQVKSTTNRNSIINNKSTTTKPNNNNHATKLRLYNDNITKLKDDMIKQLMPGNDITEDDMDPKYVRLLKELRALLNSRKPTIEAVKNIIGDIHEETKQQESLYAASLLFPFKVRGIRIPNTIPVPSATFTLQSNVNLTTNASGNVAFCFSPGYLTSGPQSSLTVNNNVLLLGTGSVVGFNAVAIGQQLPAPFYTRFRVVSAAWRITYTSAGLTTAGFMTTSIAYVPAIAVAVGSGIVEHYAFGDFSLIENGQYKDTVSAAQGARLENIYLPPDEDYLKFLPLPSNASPYLMCGYITGSPPSATVARMDIVVNYEAIVDNSYTDYIPTSYYGNNPADLSRSFRAVSKLSSSNTMSEPARVEALDSVTPKYMKSQTLSLPPSRKEQQQTKTFLDSLGDMLIDGAASVMDSFIPFSGTATKGIIKSFIGNNDDTQDIVNYSNQGRSYGIPNSLSLSESYKVPVTHNKAPYEFNQGYDNNVNYGSSTGNSYSYDRDEKAYGKYRTDY